jgi:uncharacterized protein YjbI with pentapeptide repeats
MSSASFANGTFAGTFMRAANMKGAVFHSSTFDDCDVSYARKLVTA